ncbi:MAG: cytosine deaminase [Chloroflexi bacterium OLB15]|nr:MAG: cytosine deaminase [Chloroflexi bacterium OLB15]
MSDLTLRRCRLQDQADLVDVAIRNGVIDQISPASAQAAAISDAEIDCAGKLVTPPFVESHIHLDSVLAAGQPRFNQSGTLFEGIQIWGERKGSLTREDVKQRARAALELMATHGVLYVRTHVDVTEPRLVALDALLELREEVRDWTTVQIVAFPQDGIYSRPENDGLLEEALRRGADAVGGIPHYELTREDGVRSVIRIFDLADRYDRLIDIHCDEVDDEQSRFVEVIIAEAIKRGGGERVSASHTTAFGSYNDAYAYKLLGFLRRTNINFIANPLINITLQGRMDTYPKRRGLTRIKELWQNGVNVSLGQDCIYDPWYIFGTGSMIGVAYMTVHVSQMTGLPEIDACFDMIGKNGAKSLQIPDYGIAEGNPANLVVMDVETPFEALRYQAIPAVVISRGKVIARNQAAQQKFVG